MKNSAGHCSKAGQVRLWAGTGLGVAEGYESICGGLTMFCELCECMYSWSAVQLPTSARMRRELALVLVAQMLTQAKDVARLQCVVW